jgi:hypothetical protein
MAAACGGPAVRRGGRCAVRKVVLFAFRGEEMCFIHVLLNALSFHGAGYETRIVLEGASVTLIPLLAQSGALKGLFGRCRDAGLVAGVCRACAKKLGALEAAVSQELPLLDDMNGHAGMAPFVTQGYQVVTF